MSFHDGCQSDKVVDGLILKDHMHFAICLNRLANLSTNSDALDQLFGNKDILDQFRADDPDYELFVSRSKRDPDLTFTLKDRSRKAPPDVLRSHRYRVELCRYRGSERIELYIYGHGDVISQIWKDNHFRPVTPPPSMVSVERITGVVLRLLFGTNEKKSQAGAALISSPVPEVKINPLWASRARDPEEYTALVRSFSGNMAQIFIRADADIVPGHYAIALTRIGDMYAQYGWRFGNESITSSCDLGFRPDASVVADELQADPDYARELMRALDFTLPSMSRSSLSLSVVGGIIVTVEGAQVVPGTTW